METLREREPSLLRSVATHDVKTVGDAPTSTIHKKEVSGAANSITMVSASTPSLPTDIHLQERFAKSYCDPLFPQKSVPYLKLKRAFDILLSLTALLVFALPMLVIAALIKLTSRGPVIF